MEIIENEHCSYWGGIPQDKLTFHNRLHIGILQKAFRCGVWNIPVNWDRVKFGEHNWTRFAVHSGFATYDFDRLTRLVIAAHDNCVRVQIDPCNMQCLRVSMWTRDERGARMYQVHPTMESAVAEFRKSCR